jgi:hypothetical protein
MGPSCIPVIGDDLFLATSDIMAISLFPVVIIITDMKRE